MHKNIHTLLAASILMGTGMAAHAAPQGFEWFPRVPGPGDQLYLIVVDACRSTEHFAVGPESMATSFPHPETGVLELHYETSLPDCIEPSSVLHAIPVPEEVDGAPVDVLYSFHTRRTPITLNGQQIDEIINEIEWSEDLPSRVGIPPSISGTWFSPDHAEQGLLINMTAKRELLVGWTTYGADGKQRWFSGIAPTVSEESTVTLMLTDTGEGEFVGQPQDDEPHTVWGTLAIEYVACGEIEVTWTPASGTGLASGSATMQQLTQPHDAACDLEAYAASLDRTLTVHELDIAPIAP